MSLQIPSPKKEVILLQILSPVEEISLQIESPVEKGDVMKEDVISG
jgi:hypothetical protein